MSKVTIHTAETYSQMVKLRRENGDLKAQCEAARIEANAIVTQLSETNREYGALEAERDELERVAASRYPVIEDNQDAHRFAQHLHRQLEEARADIATLVAERDEMEAALEKFTDDVIPLVKERDDERACAINEVHRLRGFIAKVEAERDELDRGFDGLAAARDYLADRVLEMQGYKAGSHTTGTSSKSYTVPGTVNAGDPPVECVPASVDPITREWDTPEEDEAWAYLSDDYIQHAAASELLHGNKCQCAKCVPDCKTDDDMGTFDTVDDMIASLDRKDDAPVPTIEHDWVWEHGAETWLWEGEDE